MAKENEFYLRDTRSDVGSTCMFWAKNGCGYTSNLNNAEVFDFDAAQKYADEQRHFIPLSKSRVDALATTRVDVQYLELNVDFSQGVVVQRYLGQYDGNDIFFDDGNGGRTPNYDEAKVFTDLDELALLVNQAGAIHSKAFLDTIARPTLQTKNVNHRKMMTSAGIRYRAPRKSKPTTGKTRGNCPECGKITWGHNPYENEYCFNHRHVWLRSV